MFLAAVCLTALLPAAPANAYSKYSRETVMTFTEDDMFMFHSVIPPAIIPFKVKHSVDVLYKYTHKPLKKPKIKPRKVVFCTSHLSRLLPPTDGTPAGLLGYDYDVTIRDNRGKTQCLPEVFAEFDAD